MNRILLIGYIFLSTLLSECTNSSLADYNQDDLIDILDLVLIMNNILGTSSLSQIQEYASDINEDSIINIQDIIIIINIILNNI